MTITVTQIRALVADPKITGGTEIFPDTHYETIISLNDNVYRAAADAARTLAFYFADKTKVQAGPVAVENQQKAERYQSLAREYDQRAREGGGGSGSGEGETVPGQVAITGISISEMDSVRSDSDRYSSVFYRDEFSNN